MGTNCVEIISKEMIKPSSPTPHYLKAMKLSYLDQIMQPIYVSLIFFYQADEVKGLSNASHVQISQRLKKSLSDALTLFYPFAGRIQDNMVVNCNDEGVEFIEARVNAGLMNTIQEPQVEDHNMKQYVPVIDPNSTEQEKALFLVQVTSFDFGGIALGICFSHKIGDCTSVMAFVNAWAATFRGDDCGKISRFSFDLANYFPGKDFLGAASGPGPEEIFVSNEKFTTKRFVFDKTKLAALRRAAISQSTLIKDPSRVELVSAFIWKTFMDVHKAEKTFAAFHSVNLRPRKRSPSLENVLGNCIMASFAYSDKDDEFHKVVGKLRTSIRTIDDDYITKSQDGVSHLNDMYKFVDGVAKGEVEWCGFSSWCWFPVYEVNFGWGNPVWLCTAALPMKNLVILVNCRSGEGIEAWVNMEQDKLEMLEKNIQTNQFC